MALAVAAAPVRLGSANAQTPLAAACTAADAALSITAAPAQAFNGLFTTYGNDNTFTDDWTGADSTYSTPLPDGRDVWIFSDTFLGPVNANGSRPTSSPLIHNSYVVQSDGALVQTLHGGSPTRPTSLVSPQNPADWYWMGDATVEGDSLRQFVLEFESTGSSFAWVATSIATFSLPDLTLQGTSPAPSSNGVEYGSAVMEDAGYTYVYGVEDLGLVKYMHLARVPSGDLLGQWQFWTGTTWSQSPAASARITSGVSNEYSVTKIGSRYVLVTMVPLTNEIVAFAACSPTGPFTGRTHVYDAPEMSGSVFTYNAHLHPEFTSNGRFLISYNVNTTKAGDLYGDVTIYRPRFIRVWIR